MDTRKLATFVDLAQTKNYSKTAERIFSNQATVSKHILALEKAWNVQLFSRAHRTVTLTHAGETILPAVLELLEKEQQLNRVIKNQSSKEIKELVIKGIPSISQYQAFNVITDFAKQYPDVNLKFSEAETDTLLDTLDDGNADIVFTRLFGNKQLHHDMLINDQDYFVALMPKIHPLAGYKKLTMELLKNESFLLLDSSTNLFKPIISLLKEAGIEPRITYEGRRIDLILGMLDQGMGVSIMMNKSFDLTDYQNIVAIPIEPKQYSRLAFIRRHGKHSATSELFWKFAQKHEGK
ncbi:LysR family transcriptional regulator [Paucilactobacillus hokkaidonensis JCM 18461]|uniref:LysR family transcriptional regulator n=2 Tax=Paucilactobacillus hokkaidonensis TaxID=1193095 RepID=A0A0A1GTA2_9LACO|nr:LysR family transcriptional regulator [Paucilactobacillus hokkaidonensis]KRO09585.1 LysR family transcriptional regulator [Paucilactobacillus hokkaidonensis]BAP85190.1 LysR family transcriptional regulator [Paucilactobacillus hokkaidonensis JCM 18461]